VKVLALCVLLAACAGTSASRVGPYVKHVARNGDWLAIYKCLIVLEDSDLHERNCTVEQIPLAAIPQMQMAPPAAAQPPAAPRK